MKFLHTGDLHIGKTINDFPMIEDQKHIMKHITDIALREGVDAIVIAGDIYDRAIPPAEAVVLLNDYLTQFRKLEIPVFLISGNHDSPERISFAEEILQEKDIYIAGLYQNELREVCLEDSYGEISFVLMPFVKAAVVGEKSNEDAVMKMLDETNGLHNSGGAPNDKNSKCKKRRVLITHYFVTDGGKEPELSESETTIHVGGLDNVEAALLDGFDYVALGHIHKPQKIGDKNIYYAGAPLAYSFSESGTTKSVNIVEMKQKGDILVRQIPLVPLHEMRKIRGKLEDLIQPDIVEAANCFDYIQASLTNEEELIDPIGTLRSVYPNIMQIILTKNEMAGQAEYESKAAERRKSIPELFADFYEIVREGQPDEERRTVIEEAAREAGE